MEKYSDDFFLKELQKSGQISAYGLAKKCNMHHRTVRNRLKDLYDRGLILQMAPNPAIYGPVPGKDKIKDEYPSKEHKVEFFSSLNEKEAGKNLCTVEEELLELMQRREKIGEGDTATIFKLSNMSGYHRETVGKALRHMENKGYVTSRKEGRNTLWSVSKKSVTAKGSDVVEFSKQKPLLSVESLLNIVKNAVIDMESQVTNVLLQNQALKNTIEKTASEGQRFIDEETIRADERNKVFVSLSNIMGLSPGLIADWYKAGKER